MKFAKTAADDIKAFEGTLSNVGAFADKVAIPDEKVDLDVQRGYRVQPETQLFVTCMRVHGRHIEEVIEEELAKAKVDLKPYADTIRVSHVTFDRKPKQDACYGYPIGGAIIGYLHTPNTVSMMVWLKDPNGDYFEAPFHITHHLAKGFPSWKVGGELNENGDAVVLFESPIEFTGVVGAKVNRSPKATKAYRDARKAANKAHLDRDVALVKYVKAAASVTCIIGGLETHTSTLSAAITIRKPMVKACANMKATLDSLDKLPSSSMKKLQIDALTKTIADMSATLSIDGLWNLSRAMCSADVGLTNALFKAAGEHSKFVKLQAAADVLAYIY